MAPATNDIFLRDQVVQTDQLLFPALHPAISLISGGRIVFVHRTHCWLPINTIRAQALKRAFWIFLMISLGIDY